MANGDGSIRSNMGGMSSWSDGITNGRVTPCIHPAWSALVGCCQELWHGEIECFKIQDGLPVLAEVTKKKVKFG